MADKLQIISNIVDYFKNTHIFKVIVHALIIMFVCFCISITYITTVHFDYLIKELENIRHPTIDLDAVKRDLNRSIRINVELERTLKNINNSGRAYVVQFHNGRANAAGISFLYQSITHEQTLPGIQPIMPTFQNIPLSDNPTRLNNFVTKQCNAGKGSDTYGSSYTVACPMYYKDGIVGYIAVDFVGNVEHENSDIIETIINNSISSIQKLVVNDND